VNYADDSNVFLNTNFAKTWRIKNIGSCTWTSGYKIIFVSGDKMGAPDETSLTGGSVPPDATVDISVPLKAPNTEGTYRGNFLLRSPENVVFGIGSGLEVFWVQIKAVSIHLVAPVIPFKIISPTPTLVNKLHLIPGLPIIVPMQQQ
jgi:hypothetical protein